MPLDCRLESAGDPVDAAVDIVGRGTRYKTSPRLQADADPHDLVVGATPRPVRIQEFQDDVFDVCSMRTQRRRHPSLDVLHQRGGVIEGASDVDVPGHQFILLRDTCGPTPDDISSRSRPTQPAPHRRIARQAIGRDVRAFRDPTIPSTPAKCMQKACAPASTRRARSHGPRGASSGRRVTSPVPLAAT